MSQIALLGPPNAGKTSLFNWMTGSNFKTVNYPGATVSYFTAQALDQYKCDVEVIDTPGVYSLFPKTQEEEITNSLLRGENKNVDPEAIIVVVDATQFERHMGLVEQAKKLRRPIIVALTMLDILKESGTTVNFESLSKEIDAPVVPIDGLLGGGVPQLMKVVNETTKLKLDSSKSVDLMRWTSVEYEKSFKKWKELRNKFFEVSEEQKKWNHKKVTERLDSVLLHPVGGLFFFFTVMSALFTSVYSLAGPLIDAVDSLFSTMGEWVIQMGGESLFTQFLSDGVIAGFGAFMVFVPQVAILFLGLILLEDSGYLARATTLVDKPLSKLGLNGRSFVPLLSGYACAVPAAMAARTIAHKKERWLTLFALPLMTCSARLPVYALLIAFFFMGQPAWYGGLLLAFLYFASLILGGVAALILRRFLPFKGESFFLMELPLYRLPQWKSVLSQVFAKTKYFVVKAGPIIFVLSVIIWVGSVFPNYNAESEVERLQTSYISQFGQVIEPVFEPMGVDWRVGVGLISAFAAREVFVSALAVVFNVTEETAAAEGNDPDEAGIEATLLGKMKTARLANGNLIFTPVTVIALIIFFMIALQCVATVGVIYQETGSVKFVIGQLVAFNLVAYLLAVGVFQLFS